MFPYLYPPPFCKIWVRRMHRLSNARGHFTHYSFTHSHTLLQSFLHTYANNFFALQHCIDSLSLSIVIVSLFPLSFLVIPFSTMFMSSSRGYLWISSCLFLRDPRIQISYISLGSYQHSKVLSSSYQHLRKAQNR